LIHTSMPTISWIVSAISVGSFIIPTNAPFSGELGLGFQPLVSPNATTLSHNIFLSNQLTLPLMSFWLSHCGDVTGTESEEPGGIFTLGGMNSSLYVGEIEFFPL